MVSNTTHPYRTQTLREQKEGSRDGLEGNGPVIIGIGHQGAAAVERITQVDGLPDDLSCYLLLPGDGQDDNQGAAAWFDLSLSGILVLGSDDPWAIEQAQRLTDEMVAEAVYMKVAVLIGKAAIDKTGNIAELPLDAVISLSNSWNDAWPAFYQPLLQVTRMFFGEAGLVCVDEAELKEMLTLGGKIWGVKAATYVSHAVGGDPEKAAHGLARQMPENTTTIIAMMQDGVDLLISDFDDIHQGLLKALHSEATVLLKTHINTMKKSGEAYLVALHGEKH